MAKKTLSVTEDEYRDLCDENSGWCVECGEINYGMHEPDAEGYSCENCGADASMGVEQALMCGYVEIIAPPSNAVFTDDAEPWPGPSA